MPRPASEMKLHVSKGRPQTLQEAVAYATEVNAVVEAENKKIHCRKGVGSTKDHLTEEVKKLKVKKTWLK